MEEEYLQQEDEGKLLQRVKKGIPEEEYQHNEGGEYNADQDYEEYIEDYNEGDYDPNQYNEEGYYDDDGQYYNDEYNNNDENFIMDADYLPGGEKYGQIPSKKKEKLDKKAKKAKAKGLPLPESKIKSSSSSTPLSFTEYLEKYYQLDYEDIVGGVPTRFKYRQVPGESYDLTPTEILLATDQELNELVSLKQIAPYRRSDLVERDRKRRKSYAYKTRLKEIKHAIALRNEPGASKKKRKRDDGSAKRKVVDEENNKDEVVGEVDGSLEGESKKGEGET
ncbi:hypothetical protein HK096_000890, partial [Nowakowskiella sp. JEL0078]